MSREALLVTHTGRRRAPSTPGPSPPTCSEPVSRYGCSPRRPPTWTCPVVVPVGDPDRAADGVEIVFALGGDGTFLRAAELARPAKAPLLGINLGKVGFLAEAEIDDLDQAVHRVIVAGDYTVDERLTARRDGPSTTGG